MVKREGDTKESFGKALKKARVSRKATLREVGDYISKTIGYLCDIEHDRKRPPDLDTVTKIEDFLSINDGHLLNLARKIRSSVKPTWTQRLKRNPEMSTVLLRADQLPDDKKNKAIKVFLETIEKFEEEES